MRRFLLSSFTLLSLLLAAPAGFAQWVTETYNLKAGWTAVYLHVDASHETLNTLVGSDTSNPIEEIWLWMPATGTMQFFDNPQQPISGSTQWVRWDRYWGAASPLQRLAPNAAYLVRVRSDVPDYTWTVTGKPMPPSNSWTSSGLNFIGFSTPRTNPPTWGTFLGPSRDLHDNAEIYRYPGGPFSETNPSRLWPMLLRQTPLTRGQAYWVRAEEQNSYFGPFEVTLQGVGDIRFGSEIGQYRVRLRNTIDEIVVVSAQLVNSADVPSGQRAIKGNVPLLLRSEISLIDLTYDFTHFADGPAQWTLQPAGQPGSEVEVILGVDRSAMIGDAGDFFAGVLRMADGSGLIQIDLPVSAEIASTSGLWVGNAIVNEVRHNLAFYAASEPGELAQNEDGSYVVEAVDESFGPVARPFPLRLIVHNNGATGATLLQRIYYGPLTEDAVVLTKKESVLDPTRLADARRISVAHLPWTENNVSWPFNGPLDEAAVIMATVPLSYSDHAANPFLHTYHPDHDNLDARFEQSLPQGFESFGVTRAITLRVLPPGGDFASVTAGSGILSGAYEETITVHGRGTFSRQYQVRGGFALNRVVDIADLTD